MPSTFYRVEITALGAAAPADGFIDPTKVEKYMTDGTWPTDMAASEAKERANLRWVSLLAKVQMLANVYVSNIEATGATVNLAPTKVSFTVQVEHGDDALYTADELTPGSFLTGTAALKRALARVFVMPDHEEFADVFDPERIAPGVDAPKVGMRIQRVVVGQAVANLTLAEAAITITAIPL